MLPVLIFRSFRDNNTAVYGQSTYVSLTFLQQVSKLSTIYYIIHYCHSYTPPVAIARAVLSVRCFTC